MTAVDPKQPKLYVSHKNKRVCSFGWKVKGAPPTIQEQVLLLVVDYLHTFAVFVSLFYTMIYIGLCRKFFIHYPQLVICFNLPIKSIDAKKNISL
jgi:hypothetical protein